MTANHDSEGKRILDIPNYLTHQLQVITTNSQDAITLSLKNLEEQYTNTKETEKSHLGAFEGYGSKFGGEAISQKNSL